MPQLAIDSTCLAQYDKLDRPTRERLAAVTRKFRELSLRALLAHPDLRIQALPAGQDPRIRTFRISDSWTGVMLAPESGETFLLVHLLPRESAEEWASDQRHDVNTVMGTLERRDATALEERSVAPGARPEADPALFSGVSDEALRQLGVDSEIIRFCRTLSTRDELADWGPAVPQDQYEVLIHLAEGMPVDQVMNEVVLPRRAAAGGRTVPPDDYDAAIRNTRHRVRLVKDDEEVDDVLGREFDAWRVFLHPTQRSLAYRPAFSGPAMVSGGPGTGKTVVALHRVKYLAENLPLGGKVLLTTFTNALVESIRRDLALLVGEELRADVDVITADKLALDVVRAQHPDVSMRRDADARGLFANVVGKQGLLWSADFVFQEYRHVVMAQGITTVEGYLDPDARRGRSTPLTVDQRREVWNAIATARAWLRRTKQLPTVELHAEAARILDERAERPYSNVVVDEGQDLHPAQWRTLRAAVSPGRNDMFIAGDNRQRIYDNTVSFKQLGIRIVGRSYPLRVNYRTTTEILTWADQIMRGQSVHELGTSAPEAPGSTRSLLRGNPPVLCGAADPAGELAALERQLRGWLADGVAPGDICVTTRTRKVLTEVVGFLRSRGLPVARFNPQHHTVDDSAGTVRVTTMHGVKGLEFRAIAVFGATAGALPLMEHVTGPELDENQHRSDLAAQRSLLYVACTRARESLYVSWHGEPSPFLPVG
ncbi:UvrD-helicase domain-containing protein [Nocardiopsis ansamitocini]|uniref:DNA 3'-5' helicase n=1 Tax=Nocardiopsis ansamitocini TaxID=1670832 RepID=A0A9W6P604_9ACTN|nr:UvrD-helicase domain-containing protein [Nocardiopsis ansamitocini]GLU47691.1 DNA helicase [Nocardiopsis ansamitocini]